MPEGFNKVSDLKIVISAATGQLESGIKSAQSLIQAFSTDATSGFGELDGALGKLGGSVGAFAGRLNVAMNVLSVAGAIIERVGAAGEKVAAEIGAETEFSSLQTAIGDVQAALLGLAGVAFQEVKKEATQAAVSLMGFEASTGAAEQKVENLAQRVLRGAGEGLKNFAQSVNELAPLEQQTYNTLATSLERIDDKIKDIEASMASGSREATSWWYSLRGFDAEGQLQALKAQKDAIAAIVSAENEKWSPSVATPDADRALSTLEREIRLIEAKAAALTMTADAAATYMLRERIRLDLEQQPFAYSPDGERQLEELITRYTNAQRGLESGQEAKRQEQIAKGREKSIEGVFANMKREIELEQLRARTVGLSADEAKRLTYEEMALSQIRRAGREPTQEEIERARELAAERVATARATAELSGELHLLQDHARIAGRSLESAFSGWIRGTETSWQSMVSKMLEDMAMLSARNLVFEPLFGGGSGGGAGVLGDFMGSLFGGYRADGGGVDAGRAFMVGERGPELFIPSQSGTIVPNEAMRGAGGGRIDVYLHPTSEFDARVRSTAEGVVVQRVPEIVGRSVEAVQDYRERTGLD